MNHRNNCDHTNCTAGNNNKSVCQTLSEMDWERGLWYAAFYGDEKKVKQLLDKSKTIKETVNAPDNAGYTPLHYAARRGHVDICKTLLQNGAAVDAHTKCGKATPLHKAASAGKTEVVKILIQCGACVEMQDTDGQTILHKAVENKHVELVNYLAQTYPQLSHIKDRKGNYAILLNSE